MKKKQLMIGIPTKDHPKHMMYYLSIILPEAKKYNIDIWVYDSSGNEDVKYVVDVKLRMGFTNLFYKRLPEEMMMWEKLKYIMVGSGYEYVWLCGDGLVICLDQCIDTIRKEMYRKKDIIVLSDERAEQMDMEDAVTWIKNCSKIVPAWGRCIVRGDLFHSLEWDCYEKKYRNWVIWGACAEKYAIQNLHTVCIRCTYFKPNPFKKYSSWVAGGELFDTMKDWIIAVKRLPSAIVNDSMKEKLISDMEEAYLTTEKLWVWRWDGNLDWKKALKYRKSLQKYGRLCWQKILFVSCCPKSFAAFLSVICGSKGELYPN